MSASNWWPSGAADVMSEAVEHFDPLSLASRASATSRADGSGGEGGGSLANEARRLLPDEELF